MTAEPMGASPRDEPQSLLSHLNELRWRIIRSAIGVGVGALAGFAVVQPVRALLERPFMQACPGCVFQSFSPAEQLSVYMRIALFVGIVIASPVVLYQIWAFVSPALTDRERKWVVPIISSCVALFVFGVVFGYWALPRALEFLLGIFDDVRTDLRIGDYFSFVLRFLLAFGVSFLFPVFLFATAAVGVVSSEQLARGRRWAVLIIVIVAAAITPTGDALTLAMLSVPLYVFYEVTYWLVRLVLRR